MHAGRCVLTLPDRYSMSFVQDASRCLRMAALRREVDTAGEDATVGTITHDVAALAGLRARRLGVETLPADDLEHLARTVLRNPGDGVKPLSLDGWRSVIRLSRRLAHSYEEGPSAVPLGARYEVYATRELDDRIVSARIDWMLIDGAVCWIKDYKSGGKNAGWEPTDQGEVNAWQPQGAHGSGARRASRRFEEVVACAPAWTSAPARRCTKRCLTDAGRGVLD